MGSVDDLRNMDRYRDNDVNGPSFPTAKTSSSTGRINISKVPAVYYPSHRTGHLLLGTANINNVHTLVQRNFLSQYFPKTSS